MTRGEMPSAHAVLSSEDLLRARRLIPQIYLDEKVKNYILDTNVLLHDPNSVVSFQDNHVLIPIEVIEETYQKANKNAR